MELSKIFIAFGSGLLSFFSPCVLPLIPAYICFITGLSIEELSISQEKRDIKPILAEAVLFILGFSAVFIILGASATFLGSYLLAKQKIFRIIGGAVVILFGLHLIGFFKIRPLQHEKRIHFKTKPFHMLGSFLIGAAFGFGWTPCIGPLLGGILILAATRETLSEGVLLLSSYSLGLAVPFLLASLGIGWLLSLFTRIKKYFKLISVASGALLIIVGIWIIKGGF